jgi:hypothetical protein
MSDIRQMSVARQRLVNLHVNCHPVPGGYEYGDLALRVGGVSNETVKYGLSSAGLGPERDCSGKAQKQLCK